MSGEGRAPPGPHRPPPGGTRSKGRAGRPQLARDVDGVVEAFAKAVRRLRLERELTVDQLAERAGLTGGEISRVERGYREPRLSTIVQIARGLGVGVDALIVWEKKKP